MRRLLVAGALTVFAVAGSVAAWKLSSDSRELAALTLATEPSLVPAKDAGPRMTSPSGEWEVSVTDAGIVWKGPGGSITVSPDGVALKSNTALRVQGAGAVSVQGNLVRLCGSGGRPVARVGDLTNAMVTFVPPATPVPSPGPIFQGSAKVFTC